MKYLITGGCGFIGVNFAEALLARNDEVILVDNLSRKGTVANLEYLKQKYPSVEFEHADVRMDNNKLLSLVDKVEVVFHLAGQVAVTTSYKEPREDFEINALGTFNVLEAVRMSDKKPMVVYASTNKVYGGMTDIEVVEKDGRYAYKDMPEGIPEDRLLDFHSPYGCSKGVADQYARDYSRMYEGLKTVVMRQSCIYGKRQFGIEDQGWVAWFAIAALLNRPITIYGDGKQVRDVLYAEDLFNAWDLAVKNIDKVSGSIFNIGGGHENTLSLLELLGILEKRLGRKINYGFGEVRPGDQPVYISDISKAKKELGWEPTTKPEEGVDLLIDWIKENEDVIKAQLGF